MSHTPTPHRVINDAAEHHRAAWVAYFANPLQTERPDLLLAYRRHVDSIAINWQADLLRQLLVAELDVRRRKGQENPRRDEYHRIVDELPEVTDCGRIVDELISGGLPAAAASSPQLVRGSRVLGYVLEARLGAGSFGEVWQAKADSEFEFHAALKFVRLGQAVDAEARALAIVKEVTHPYLVSTFKAERVSEYLVIAMELAEGSLANKLAGARAEGLLGIPFEALLDYLDGAAEALDHLNSPQHVRGGRPGVAVQHCDIACLTRGAQGSVIVTAAGERVEIDAFPVDHLVDTTGAGDLYAAGFLFGHAQGKDLAESGRIASMAAAECISHIGPRPEVSLQILAEKL